MVVVVVVVLLLLLPRCCRPNLCVGTITRDSVIQAFGRGISARQICEFLSNHAHERMLSSRPVVPETVCDQIMLWETEQPSHRCAHSRIPSVAG